MRVVRRRGPISLLRREKNRDPRMKQAIDVRDLAQPYGLYVLLSLELPRPTKMVLPGMGGKW